MAGSGHLFDLCTFPAEVLEREIQGIELVIGGSVWPLILKLMSWHFDDVDFPFLGYMKLWNEQQQHL